MPVAVFPATTSDASATTQAPWTVFEYPTAFFPYGWDVREHDTVTVTTGPLAGVWAVKDAPKHWRNPMTGWSPGCQVSLEAVRGR